jgi:hypothetical protein
MLKRKLLSLLLISIAGLIILSFWKPFTGKAFANTYFVSLDGDDKNIGSFEEPFQSPRHALDVAESDDTIYLRTGVYNVSERLEFAGKTNMTMATYGGDAERATINVVIGQNGWEKMPISILDSQNITIKDLKIVLPALFDDEVTTVPFFGIVVSSYSSTSEDITLSNLDIQGGAYYGIKLEGYVDDSHQDPNQWIYSKTKDVIIRNCTIHHTGADCIKSTYSDNLLIENCDIGHSGQVDNTNAEGIDIIGSRTVNIKDCYVHDTATCGIYLKGGTIDGVVERCYLENIGITPYIGDAGRAGILLGQDTDKELILDQVGLFEAENCVAKNNVVAHARGAGLGTYSGKNIEFLNNTLYDVASMVNAGFYISLHHYGNRCNPNDPLPAFSRQITFKNNIVVILSGNQPMATSLYLADQLDSANNIWFRATGGSATFNREYGNCQAQSGMTLSQWQDAMDADSGSVVGDPQLDINNMYRPSGSLAINTGLQLLGSDPLTADDVLTDYSLITRPQGSAYDIGAHESVSPPSCITVPQDGNWRNTAFSSQFSIFTTQVDAKPTTLAGNMDTGVGLSLGTQPGPNWTGMACIVRFYQGNIQARNGSDYPTTPAYPFTVNTTYHIRMVVNVPNHTYSVYVKPSGGSETLLAQNYAFRTEQNDVTYLNNFVRVSIEGSLEICNFTKISCAYLLSATSIALPANGGTRSFSVQSSTNCDWTATTTDSWINITSGNSGSGNGTVTFDVASHTNASNRSGTIRIGDQTFRVLQGVAFSDVPTNHPFYTEIGKLSARGVTLGCDTGVYCPDSVVTREQMAAFIMRARGEFNQRNPIQQRFTDVPPTHPFYKFIDRMAVLQITTGCDVGIYCPGSDVTREQMAAFIIRALHEPGYDPPTPGTQRFNDVATTHDFYDHIEEMAVRGITLGCSTNPPLYCPTSGVTRAQMAAFLVRAFNM